MSCGAWHLTSMPADEYDPSPVLVENENFKKYLNDY